MAKSALARVVLFGFALLLAAQPVPCRAQTIQTVVGGGFHVPTAPYTAPFSFSVGLTQAVAADSSGNVYVADVTHGSVYRVAGNSVSVVAGNGTPGNTPVLQNPTGLAIDGNGDLFIADQDAGIIYKVATSSGAVQVVAGCGSMNNPSCPIQPNYGDGGKATSAFIEPASVSLDNSGNIFIADVGTCRIRKVNATNGIIATVAGTICPMGGLVGPVNGPATSAQLYFPQGVTVDSSGDIFIADTGVQLVLEVCGSGGACGTPGNIRTVAGGGTQAITSGLTGVLATDIQFMLPRALALDGENLYIADFDQDVVAVVNTGTSPTMVEGQSVLPGYIQFVIGTVSAPGSPPIDSSVDGSHLNGPAGLAFSGELYIADSLNYAVRSVSTSSSSGLSRVAGNNMADSYVGGQSPLSIQLATPVAVSEDASANIYVSQSSFANVNSIPQQGQSNARLFQVIPSTPAIKQIAAPSQPPIGLFLDNSDNVFFADGGLNELSQAYGVVSIGVNFLPNQDDTSFLDLAGEKANNANNQYNLYFTGYARHPGVVDFIADYSTSSFLVNPGVALQPGHYPYSSAALGDGKPAQDAQFLNISGLCTDNRGNVYVTDNGTYLVRAINTSQQATTIANQSVPANSVETVGGGGGALPGNPASHFDYGAEQIGDGGPATGALLSPQACFVDNLDNVFVADGYNDRIRRIDSNTGIITTVAGSEFPGFSGDNGAATGATLNFPNSVWGDQAGNLLISDSGNHRIREISGILPVPNASVSCQNCAIGNATGSSQSATVVLTNLFAGNNVGTAPLVMSAAPSLISPTNDFKISGTTCQVGLPGLATNASCMVTVVATGTAAASIAPSTNVVFHDNAFLNNASKPNPDPANAGQRSGYLQYSDPITFTYMRATVGLQPLSLVFTAENVAQAIKVVNSGAVPLILSNINVPAPFTQTNPSADSCMNLGTTPTLATTNAFCNIYLVLPPPPSGWVGNDLQVTFSDNTTVGTESIPLLGYALVPTGSPSLALSNKPPASVMATFQLVGIPASGTTVTPVCTVIPAGLDLACNYDAPTQTITATAMIPSCVQGNTANLPANTRGQRFASLGVVALALLLPWKRSGRKRWMASMAFAAVSYVLAGVSACSSTSQLSSSCVASVNPGTTFKLNVTANIASSSTASSGTTVQYPSLTLTSPDTITVTQ
jgi:hypothetical protein